MADWEPLKVIEKDGGRVIVIKDFRFNPELHEKIVPKKAENGEGFECDICGKVVKTAPALKRHMTMVHS